MATRTNNPTPKVWKTAAYIRLSREDAQTRSGDRSVSESVVNQQQIIDNFIASQPDLGSHLTFIDDGATGTNFDRAGFQNMMEEIHKGTINCVVVKDLSRFGRNYTEAGVYMEQVFPMLGVRFIAINDHVDSFLRPSEMDSILIPLKNILNDSYSRDLSVKVKSAMTAIRKRGEFIGAFAAFGYLCDPEDKKKLVVDRQAAPIVEQIFRWYAEGMGKNRIALTLNEMGIPSPARYRLMNYPPKKKHSREYANRIMGMWSVQSITTILMNPLYCGHMAQGKRTYVSYKNAKQVKIGQEDWIVVENTHEPIIEQELFDRVQELLKIRAKPSNFTGKVYLFSGLLKCADCKRTMDRSTNRKRNGDPYYFYRCSTHFRRLKTACTTHIIPEKALEEAVLASVKSQIAVAANVDTILKNMNVDKRRMAQMDVIERQIATAEKQIADTETLKMGLYADLKHGILTEDEYISLKSNYTSQLEQFSMVVQSLNEEKQKLDEQEELQNSWVERFRQYGNIDTLTRELVVALIERIYIHEGHRITIQYKFQDEFEKILTLAEQEKDNLINLVS